MERNCQLCRGPGPATREPSRVWHRWFSDWIYLCKPCRLLSFLNAEEKD